MIGELLAYVRRGDVEAVHSLRRGAAEALEAIVRGDKGSCRLAGRRIERDRAAARGADRRHRARPAGARRRSRRWATSAATRAEVIIAHHDTLIQTDDRVIVFMPSKKQVREVEKLFQVVGHVLLTPRWRSLLPLLPHPGHR